MTTLNEATEAQLTGRLAELRAKSAEPDYEAWRPALSLFYTVESGTDVSASPFDSADKRTIRGLITALPLAPRPAEAMDDAAGRWPSDAELRELAEDVGDTLDPPLEMARRLREWQTGGVAYGKKHTDGSRSGGQKPGETE
jgi:hypothetical protein